MKLKIGCVALAFCMLTLCSCSTPQSNATEMEQAITSFLEDAQSKENAEQLPSVSEATEANSVAQEVPYVFIDLDNAPQKLIVDDAKDAFTVLSARSTYLPAEKPYGEEQPSKLFPKSNYFLWSANLEVEGQFLFRGTLQKSEDPQYDGWWIFTLTEDSVKALPQISETPHSNVLYLPASVADSATTHQGDIVEIALTKLFIRYGQGDMVHTGN